MTEETGNPKPKWLRRLERESWQAELIISGAAIFGCLQLPGLIENFEHYLLLNFDRESLYYFFVVIIYWRIVAIGLIAVFIFHFIVRALWIGLVGLNSVFPGGFHPNERFSLDFQDKMRATYGDIDGYIQKLDRLGSGIFGIGFGIAGVFINLGILGCLLVFAYGWLVSAGVDAGWIKIALLGIMLFIFLFGIVSTFLHTKSMRDKEWVKQIHWPMTKLMSQITYPLNSRYITTSLNMVSTYYADRKGYYFAFLGITVSITAIGLALVFQDPNSGYFSDKIYHRLAADSTRVSLNAYAENEYEGIYFRPLLPTETVSDSSHLLVWIPLPEREMVFLEKQCSAAPVDDDLPSAERRVATWQRTISCAQEYISITINGQPINGYPLKREYRENETGSQFGVRAYITDPPLRKGENMLGVVTQYPHEDSGEPRQAWVPFYFVGG